MHFINFILFHFSSSNQSIVLRGHRKAVTDVKFSNLHPILLSVSRDSTLRAWHADTYTCASVYRLIFKLNMKYLKTNIFTNPPIVLCLLGVITVRCGAWMKALMGDTLPLAQKTLPLVSGPLSESFLSEPTQATLRTLM